MKFLAAVLFLSLFIGHTTPAFAQDVEGARDAPDIGRFPGSIIVQFEATPYDEGLYPLGANSSQARDAFPSEGVKGARTTIVYDVPADLATTLLEVFRSFEAGLVDNGHRIDFSCDGRSDACGYFFTRALFSGEARTRFAEFAEFNNLHGEAVSMLSAQKDNSRVIIVVGKSRHARTLQYAVDAYEIKDASISKLVLSEQGMAKGIADQGAAALDGLYFETGKAELTDASRASLETIAAFLRNRPNHRYLVVGHTDNVGGFGDNQQLSERRAQAVVRYLESVHDVNVGMLRSVGVGYASPVSTNATDEGKATNRRVELVFERVSNR